MRTNKPSDYKRSTKRLDGVGSSSSSASPYAHVQLSNLGPTAATPARHPSNASASSSSLPDTPNLHANSSFDDPLELALEEDEEEFQPTRKQSCWHCCRRICFSWNSTTTFRERRIYFNPSSTTSSAAISASVGASGSQLESGVTFPPNVVRNTKYNLLTFIPRFLYNEFKFFFNFYFLLVSLSQFIPILQIGFLFTYVAPLVFVLTITMTKEAYDDIQRWLRDREANSQRYIRLRRVSSGGGHVEVIEESIPSSEICVGDLLLIHTNQRVPADLLLLRTHDRTNGSVFIRTDQLDGETDWKLRIAIQATQALSTDGALCHMSATIQAEAPRKDIYDFAANFTTEDGSSSSSAPSQNESLTLDHTIWANTVLASGTIVGLVIYTGTETRSVMNANMPVTKIGLLDAELNRLSKLLFCLTVILAFLMTALNGLNGTWFLTFFRFILLFSSIIPISMRVNLDMGKTLYSWLIMRDESIPDTIVRNSTIPEELGRIAYLFSDKTGTLTRNVMQFKCIQMEPPVFFTKKTIGRLRHVLEASFRKGTATTNAVNDSITSSSSSSSSSSISHDHALSPSDDDLSARPRASSLTSFKLNTTTLQVLGREDEDLSDGGSNGPSSQGEQGSFIRMGSGGKQHGGYVNLLREREEEEEDAEDAAMEMKESATAAETTATNNTLARRSSLNDAPNSHTLTHTHPLRPSSTSGRPGSSGEEDPDVDDDPTSSATAYSTVPNEKLELMVRRVITSLALCHNVTPAIEDDGKFVYQASSPDEVALVKFTESIGLKLVERTQQRIKLQTPIGTFEEYTILHIFPFTSESKRMGIILRSPLTQQIIFYLKGAESIMKTKIVHSDWLEEEVDNLARIGLRTLVIAEKILSEPEYEEFLRRYNYARSILKDRDSHILTVMSTLEKGMTLLGLTGVEDKLQEHVKSTLETLRNAGINLWMLTGDKAETSISVGISAQLIARNQVIFQLINCTTQREVARQLDLFSTKINTCLVIDGPSLQICLESFEKLFLELACVSPAVICCRCSPTQKATVVSLMRAHTGKRTAAIGDGGNDVSMILAADVGVGIVGKEGKQASLAADFSITQFSHILPLLLWHGRNAYKRSARLSQFVIHRGLIISIIQAVFSALFYFVAVPIYDGWLMVGYATFYTMLPVFSLVLDEDVDENKVYLYPELYKDLQKGRPLSFKTFFIWVFQSIYQGGVIMILSILLFETKFTNIVSITFTALIASELFNVALEVHKWHKIMMAAEILSILVYFASLLFLPTYFDITFIFTVGFLWKVVVITSVSCLPPATIKYVHARLHPSAQSKVNQS